MDIIWIFYLVEVKIFPDPSTLVLVVSYFKHYVIKTATHKILTE
jgi:hypothetical protein